MLNDKEFRSVSSSIIFIEIGLLVIIEMYRFVSHVHYHVESDHILLAYILVVIIMILDIMLIINSYTNASRILTIKLKTKVRRC
jgi:hypothetical protein